jgi:hypothetical protein
MKLSWGYKIMAAYLLFVAGMLYLVVKASNNSNDLVRADYYQAELKYQDVIDEKNRAAALSAPVNIELKDGQISVYFPGEMQGKTISGELYLYCPSDAKRDLRRSFSVDNNVYRQPIPGNAKGMYDVQLSWEAGGATYFHEQKLFF